MPLGSTTYHFADLDELVEAAVRLVATRNVARVRRCADSLTAQVDLSAELSDFLVLPAPRDRGGGLRASSPGTCPRRRPAR
ncbi:hypothetical protein BN6_40080 [Saccharothrix espanaensis DSM 44229]|uniref:Uncharacterized protein n=1 Tax=Saccharothrix espanaensis (strain ATCC 51144 / DSM 44229 / JCM 9112 / NBRC 15066 / NRRL 15764) TaxID=1179773 RepID=K0JU07_SACES|nr:hypothetical protein BN6_40080 [Saccharothrix espanaensis DSM 44229]